MTDRYTVLTPVSLAKIDPALLADLGGASGYQAFEASAPDGFDYHIVWSDHDRRAGIVLTGPGSSGATFWTDASSPQDAIARMIEDDMTP